MDSITLGYYRNFLNAETVHEEIEALRMLYINGNKRTNIYALLTRLSNVVDSEKEIALDPNDVDRLNECLNGNGLIP